MYKCIKVREIESALRYLPSVPGQCNELANISKGEPQILKVEIKISCGFRPLKVLKQNKENIQMSSSVIVSSGPKKSKILRSGRFG